MTVIRLDDNKELIEKIALVMKDSVSDAIICLRSILTDDELSTDDLVLVYSYLGQCYIKLREYGKAIEMLKRVFVLTPSHFKSYGLMITALEGSFRYGYGMREYALRGMNMSRMDTEDLTSNEENEIRDRLVVASKMFLSKAANNTLMLTDVSAVDFGDSLSRFTCEIEECIVINDMLLAKELLKDGYKKYHHTIEYMLTSIKVNEQDNNFAAMMKDCKKILKEEPTNEYAISRLLIANYSMGGRRMCKLMKECVARKYASTAELDFINETFLQIGEYEKIIEMSDNAKYGDTNNVLLIKAIAYNNLGQNDKAMVCFKRANSLYGELSTAKYFINVMLKNKYVLFSYSDYEYTPYYCLGEVRREYFNIELIQGLIDNGLNDDALDLIEIATVRGWFDELEDIIFDKRSEEFFVDNVEYFIDLMVSSTPSTLRHLVFVKLYLLGYYDEIPVQFDNYVYFPKVPIEELQLTVGEGLLMAYLYCCSVESSYMIMDLSVLDDSLKRLVDTGRSSMLCNTPCNLIAALLVRSSYSFLYGLSFKECASRYDCDVNELIELDRIINEGGKYHNDRDMQVYIFDTYLRMNDTLDEIFGHDDEYDVEELIEDEDADSKDSINIKKLVKAKSINYIIRESEESKIKNASGKVCKIIKLDDYIVDEVNGGYKKRDTLVNNNDDNKNNE